MQNTELVRPNYPGRIIGVTTYVRAGEWLLVQWIEMIRRGNVRIPSFQREFVWSDQQMVEFLESLIAGHFVGSVIIWRRFSAKPWAGKIGELDVTSPDEDGTLTRDALLVVDGQQRLGTLATAVASHRFEFDLASGRVVSSSEPGGRMMMPVRFGVERPRVSEINTWCRAHAETHALDHDELFHLVIHAIDLFRNARVAYVELPCDWSSERVAETFRKINSTGTPIDPEELRLLLERASDDLQLKDT